MRKILKKWGDSFIFLMSPEDCKAYNLKEGKVYDIEIGNLNKKKKKEDPIGFIGDIGDF